MKAYSKLIFLKDTLLLIKRKWYSSYYGNRNHKSLFRIRCEGLKVFWYENRNKILLHVIEWWNGLTKMKDLTKGFRRLHNSARTQQKPKILLTRNPEKQILPTQNPIRSETWYISTRNLKNHLYFRTFIVKQSSIIFIISILSFFV